MLRAFLYGLIAATSVLGTQFATWSNDPPKNHWEIWAVVMGTLLAVATAIRAYVDQHLSTRKNEKVLKSSSSASDNSVQLDSNNSTGV